jgi:HAD superfamily hydrolase (TIGR01490 family)
MTPRGIAFFDVDETIVSIKTMFDFYDYFLEALGYTPAEQDESRAKALALLRPGMPREQGNRLFYQRFAGHDAAEVAEIGRNWFADRLDRGGLFHRDVLAALDGHHADGLLTVLVSGSFRGPLEPLARYTGADRLLCTELEVRDGVYTGNVTRGMIGAAKADAARGLLVDSGIAAAGCFAYGDHMSDVGLLELVGHPVVVGPNPELIALADVYGWNRLPGLAARV